MLELINSIVLYFNLTFLFLFSIYSTKNRSPKIFIKMPNNFLTRELRACAGTSYRYDVGNSIRSLNRLIPVNFFSILGF